MKKNLLNFLALITLMFVMGCSAEANKPEGKKNSTEPMATTAMVGQAAPSFTLSDASGVKHSLDDYRGKYVVLEWVNFDCPFVRKHYDSNNMQTLQANYTARDIVWLSVCSSAPGKQGYFADQVLLDRIAKEQSHATAYLVDADGKVGRMYGAKTTPNMFVVDPKGNLIYAGAIDDKASTKPGDIPESKNYVVSALDAVMAGNAIETKSTQPYGCSVKY